MIKRGISMIMTIDDAEEFLLFAKEAEKAVYRLYIEERDEQFILRPINNIKIWIQPFS